MFYKSNMDLSLKKEFFIATLSLFLKYQIQAFRTSPELCSVALLEETGHQEVQ